VIEIQVNVQTQDAIRALDKLAANMIVAERQTLEDLRAGIRGDLARVTQTWNHQPVFVEYKVGAAAGDLHPARIRISTQDAIYRYVDEGTRPHIIAPRKPGGVLVFRGRYTAKTIPHLLVSRAGGASGATVFARVVHHPGTKARKFTETIMQRWQNRAPLLMERRVRMALSGMDMRFWR